jgi:hypothetical protein
MLLLCGSGNAPLGAPLVNTRAPVINAASSPTVLFAGRASCFSVVCFIPWRVNKAYAWQL